MSEVDAGRSLKLTLTRRLVIGLLVIGCVGSVTAFMVSARFANRAFDRSLFDDVVVLADQIHWVKDSAQISLSPDALIWLLADEGDDVVYRVTDLGNKALLTSNGDLGDLPDVDIGNGEPRFRTVVVGQKELRVAYVKRAVGPKETPALVEIGETTRKRTNVVHSILVGTVSMMSIFILAAVMLVRTGVQKALAPLRQLESDAAQRTIGNMQPLDAGRAPAEVQQLIGAVNHMIARVIEIIDVQRHFLANAAHQLKTPMAGLRLQAQLALQSRSIDGALENMRAVERQAIYGSHLIDQLLTLARAESGGVEPPSLRCDLSDIARDVIERTLPLAIERQIDLGYDGEGEPFVVLANPLLIGEMTSNLVDNALRHGRFGGRVTVSLRRSPGQVALLVSDDGEGFPEAHRQDVFRRFWHSDTAHSNGAGLGLAIVKEIAVRHGGDVEIVSRPDFNGTCIIVSLPVASSESDSSGVRPNVRDVEDSPVPSL